MKFIKDNRGFATSGIKYVVLIIVIGLGIYLISKQPKDAKMEKNSEVEEVNEILTACGNKLPLIEEASIEKQIKVDENTVGVTWSAFVTEADPIGKWGYAIYECQDKKWQEKYYSNAGFGATSNVDLLSSSAVLVSVQVPAAGNITGWSILHRSGETWLQTDSDALQLQAITNSNLAFRGGNTVDVVGDNIVETFPGYLNTDPIDNPSQESKKATYTWDGENIFLVSVE